MSEVTGPSDAHLVEVQGFFPDNATLQAAINLLEESGFPRGALSPPEEHPDYKFDPANKEENNLAGETDKAQLRTLGTGMAGYVGAAAVAGATIATGGAAGLAVAAAAAVGAGSAAAATGVGQAAEHTIQAERDKLGAQGRLVLAVRAETPEIAQKAMALMRQTGATHTEEVTAKAEALTAGISSASWTGN